MPESQLAIYASHSSQSKGRKIDEPAAPTRLDFQRDRDRIIHCSAFRRLVYKTQVFINHEGDMFRTRLTHTLEVAQLGKSIARVLRLNEDLLEAIALSHDLGHTPFGHAGQDELNACMQPYNGFEHNIQSLRVVDRLEQRYPQFDGLNLCFETREGILKHCAPERAKNLGDVGARFIEKKQPSMEAQLTNLADEIAYNAHDIDDGVRSGLLTVDQMRDVPLFNFWYQQVLSEYPDVKGKRLLYETIRRMLSAQVYDVIDATRLQLKKYAIESAADVHEAPVLVVFSEGMKQQSRELKGFLYQYLYRHPQVMSNVDKGRKIVRDLFNLLTDQPQEMQGVDISETRPRLVSDYIAGMTDRFAISEHERLTGSRLFK
ncbi:MAG: deoxyguanosinetriphosphate triphosphohydrolase [Saezia sp.]